MGESSVEDDAHSGHPSTGHMDENGTELPHFDFFLFLRMKSQLLGRHFQDLPEIHKEMQKQYIKVTSGHTRNARFIA